MHFQADSSETIQFLRRRDSKTTELEESEGYVEKKYSTLPQIVKETSEINSNLKNSNTNHVSSDKKNHCQKLQNQPKYDNFQEEETKLPKTVVNGHQCTFKKPQEKNEEFSESEGNLSEVIVNSDNSSVDFENSLSEISLTDPTEDKLEESPAIPPPPPPLTSVLPLWPPRKRPQVKLPWVVYHDDEPKAKDEKIFMRKKLK